MDKTLIGNYYICYNVPDDTEEGPGFVDEMYNRLNIILRCDDHYCDYDEENVELNLINDNTLNYQYLLSWVTLYWKNKPGIQDFIIGNEYIVSEQTDNSECEFLINKRLQCINITNKKIVLHNEDNGLNYVCEPEWLIPYDLYLLLCPKLENVKFTDIFNYNFKKC